MVQDPRYAEPAVEYGLLGGEHVRRGQKLFLIGCGALVLASIYLAANADVDDLTHLYQGLVIFALAFLPGLLWAKSGGSRFPVFEPLMLLCASAYAIPLLNGHQQLMYYAPEIQTQAGWAVILYQICAIATYQFTTGMPGRSDFWTQPILSRKVEHFITYGLVGSALYMAVSTFTTWIPYEFNSILRAVFFGIGILCIFIGMQQWGRGELNPTERTVMVCSLIPILVIQTIGLLLIGSITMMGIAFVGYLSGGKRIPWAPLIVAFLIVAVLHNGKSAMRMKYWENEYPAPTLTELPAFFSEWVEFGLQPPHSDRSDQREASSSRLLLERGSLMHILCLVIDSSPDRQDFLNGETYGYVLPQLIPRLFWPEKPRSHVATYRLGVYYGLQTEEGTETTTIAFGMLAEAYANFGMWGAMLLGVFWGLVFKKLQILSRYSPMFSMAGLLMILLTAWSLNSELTMAAWVSSLFQAVIVVLGVPMLIRLVFGS